MRSNEKLWEICLKIYRKMYKESTPSADFDKLMKSGEAYEDMFFLRYFLEDDRQQKIIEQVCKSNKCNKREREKINFTVNLGCSPSVSKERWMKEVKKSKRRGNEKKTRVCKQ